MISALSGISLAADLTLELQNGNAVAWVGAVSRWDADGNPRRPVDPKASFDKPIVDSVANQAAPGKWVFSNLAPGRYDLILRTQKHVRIEGFDFPPVLEFDPFFSAAQRPAEAARDWVAKDIAKSRHYENKVLPLYFAGDDKQIRVFVQLLRDEPTSYDADYGQPVATLRHEIWQYTHRYGAWTKEKRTRVFDRVLTAKRELRQWTWVWDPLIGGIEIQDRPVTVRFRLPSELNSQSVRGLLPY